MWKDCKPLQEHIVALRRALHQVPEMGLDLPETCAIVRAELDRLGIPYITSAQDSGLIATIKGGRPGKRVALRADMDALPITEATGLPFASRHEGLMHACGHDAHTA
ncbi:MAG: M20/M25/M40 family metallo-hydrolase, partial [Oscillospiraceae bacterium]|nr:M20/M25/M40 family metallo-hydrolase [Oscillospiraceae bacterium]